MSAALNIVFSIIILTVVYLLKVRKRKPAWFNKEKEAGETVITEKLTDIRRATEAFIPAKGCFTGGYGLLITCIKTGNEGVHNNNTGGRED
jgi:hypothetical protein